MSDGSRHRTRETWFLGISRRGPGKRGKGFNLINAKDGVMFDITGDGKLWQMSWTAGVQLTPS